MALKNYKNALILDETTLWCHDCKEKAFVKNSYRCESCGNCLCLNCIKEYKDMNLTPEWTFIEGHCFCYRCYRGILQKEPD
jgi:hypothetical protein